MSTLSPALVRMEQQGGVAKVGDMIVRQYYITLPKMQSSSPMPRSRHRSVMPHKQRTVAIFAVIINMGSSVLQISASTTLEPQRDHCSFSGSLKTKTGITISAQKYRIVLCVYNATTTQIASSSQFRK